MSAATRSSKTKFVPPEEWQQKRQQREQAQTESEPLPQNDEAEAAIIGMALEGVFGNVPNEVPYLQADHFRLERNRQAWTAISRLMQRGESVNLISVYDELMAAGVIGEGKSFANFADVNGYTAPGVVPPGADAAQFGRIVYDKHLRRTDMQQAANLCVAAATLPDQDYIAYRAKHLDQLTQTPATAGSSRFQLKSITQLRERPRPEYIVGGILQERKLGLVWGATNTGKSFLTLDWALCLATGTPWHGKPVKAGHVVYVCAEGVDGIRDRVDAWLAMHGIVDAPRFHVIDESPNLLEEGDVEEVIAQVRPLGEAPIAVIFDTLACSMEGGDENSPEDMGLAVAAMKRVQRELKTAVLTVHHAGKDDSRGPRAHSILASAMDTCIKVEKELHSDAVTVSCTKAKDAPLFSAVQMTLRRILLDDFGDVTSCVLVAADGSSAAIRKAPKLSTKQQLVLDVLESFADGARTTDLLAATGITARSTFFAALAELKRRDLAYRDGGEEDGVWRVVRAGGPTSTGPEVQSRSKTGPVGPEESRGPIGPRHIYMPGPLDLPAGPPTGPHSERPQSASFPGERPAVSGGTVPPPAPRAAYFDHSGPRSDDICPECSRREGRDRKGQWGLISGLPGCWRCMTLWTPPGGEVD